MPASNMGIDDSDEWGDVFGTGSMPAVIEKPQLSEPAPAQEIVKRDFYGLCGIYYDVSNEEYHACRSISKSGLDAFSRSPAHYQAYLNGEREETNALKRGTLIHCAVLEPDFLNVRYFGLPEVLDVRTKIGKAKYQEYAEKSGGKIIVTAEEWRMAWRIRDEVQRHKIARLLFDGGQSEVSIFSILQGVPVRCRPDYINGAIMPDVKSTVDARPGPFLKSIEKYRYYVQAAYYMDIALTQGIEVDHFPFVAFEKEEPFGIYCHNLDADSIQQGRKEYIADLDYYKRCLDSDKWPSYPEEFTEISISKSCISRSEMHIDQYQRRESYEE